MPKYDVIIRSGQKDIHKLPQVIKSLRFLNPQPEMIYLINREGIVPPAHQNDVKFRGIRDDIVFPDCDRDYISYRKNWLFGVMMSLFQNVTQNDFYFDVNSDVFFTAPLDLFTSEGKPIFFVSPQHEHYHEPYFAFSRKMFDIERQGNDSFIMDYTMYNKSISRDILKKYGSFNDFFKEACKIITDVCYPADSELFANWCLKHNPDMYAVQRDIQTIIVGKIYPDNYGWRLQ